MAQQPEGERRLATALKKRSVTIAGHRTSVSLEPVFWDALKEIARARGQSLNALIESVDETRAGNLSSALRVFVMETLQARASSRSA